MGDRTTVILTVLTAQAEAATSHFDIGVGHTDEGVLITEFHFWEVNYGELEFLPDLVAAGIAYDSSWADGGDYQAGTEHLRFTEDGEAINKTLYDEADFSIAISDLAEIKEDHAALFQKIDDAENKLKVIELDELQIEYGKRYLSRQLIS